LQNHFFARFESRCERSITLQKSTTSLRASATFATYFSDQLQPAVPV